MIDIHNEKLLTAKQATFEPIYRRSDGRAGHVSTPTRHMSRGKLIGGRQVILESVMTPRGRMTSREAIQRFVERLSGRGDDDAPVGASPLPPTKPTPSQIRRDHAEADRRMSAAGL